MRKVQGYSAKTIEIASIFCSIFFFLKKKAAKSNTRAFLLFSVCTAFI